MLVFFNRRVSLVFLGFCVVKLLIGFVRKRKKGFFLLKMGFIFLDLGCRVFNGLGMRDLSGEYIKLDVVLERSLRSIEGLFYVWFF